MYVRYLKVSDALIEFYVPAADRDARASIAEAAAELLWDEWIDVATFEYGGSFSIDIYDENHCYLFSADIHTHPRPPLFTAKIKEDEYD